MVWALNSYATIPAATAVLSTALAAVAYRNRSHRLAAPFAALMLILAVRLSVYTVQLGFDTLAAQMRWVPVSLVVGSGVPVLWVVFAIRYADRTDDFSPWAEYLMTAEVVAFGALVATNGYHELVWRGATFSAVGAVPVADVTYALGYHVHLAYIYAISVAGIVLIARVGVAYPDLQRRQAGTIVVGALVPVAANVVSMLEASPTPGLDLTPFAFTVSGVLMAVALFQYDLLDVATVARRRWIDAFGDGVLVTDEDGRTVTVNDTAQAVFDPTPTVGDPVDETLQWESMQAVDGAVVEATVDGARRVYDVVHEQLTDHHDDPVGHLLGLREVTDRHSYEQRLTVANRVLRHNFRNDMNVVLGNAQRLRAMVDDDAEPAIDRIETHANRIVDLSEEIQEVATVLERDAEQTVDLAAVVRRVVDSVERRYPTAQVTTSLPAAEADTTVAVVDETALSTAVENVVENGIEHVDDSEPTVTVSVARDADHVAIRVVDEGPGIPAAEREVLLEGRETPLKHGSGVGLWLVNWVVAASGGEVRFETPDDESSDDGSVVELRFRRSGATAPD